MPYRVSGCFKVPLIKPFMSRIADNVVINARRAAKMVPATRYREAAACVRKKYVVGPRHPSTAQTAASRACWHWVAPPHLVRAATIAASHALHPIL